MKSYVSCLFEHLDFLSDFVEHVSDLDVLFLNLLMNEWMLWTCTHDFLLPLSTCERCSVLVDGADNALLV